MHVHTPHELDTPVPRSIPWPAKSGERAELQRISRDMDDLAVELTRVSARTRVSVHAVRRVERRAGTDVFEWASVQGFLGIERRPEHMPIAFHRAMAAAHPGAVLLALDGKPAGRNTILFKEFCSSPLPEILEYQEDGESVHVAQPSPGAQDPLDIFVAHRYVTRVPSEHAHRGLRLNLSLRIPSRQLQAHVFTHRDIEVGTTPTLKMFHGGMREPPGVAEPRWFDQLGELPPPVRVPDRPDAAGSDEERRVAAIAAGLFHRIGWAADEFVQHATAVMLPIWSLEYVLSFA